MERRARLLFPACAVWAACGAGAVGCGNSFSSVVPEAPRLALRPDYAVRGTEQEVVAELPGVDPQLVARGRVIRIDFGRFVAIRLMEIRDDGTIALRIFVDPSAALGRRLVRLDIDVGRESDLAAAGDFFVLAEPVP